ncbi:MAG: FAD-binding domain-containing protein [Acidobacteriota bacterium]
MTGPDLPIPRPGRGAAERFVAAHLAHLTFDGHQGSATIVGGQAAADAALASFDATSYAQRRNSVLPIESRGASGLSPYIRHGLLTLPQVWEHVADAPQRDREKFRDELLWQEYARHWYADLGTMTAQGTMREQRPVDASDPVWDRQANCVDHSLAELERDGWLVNQTRMWLASHWSVREGGRWQDGEHFFFRHLIDGSRAANRLGWQWTVGVGSSKTYGFSRWQVEKRAPRLCRTCSLADACPIEDWPPDPKLDERERPTPTPALHGPSAVVERGRPDAVWLTAESLGLGDPALRANPALPVVFVFDEPLLAGLQLSAKRLVFLVETLAELGTRRELILRLGDPVIELTGRALAVTHAPVPGFARRSGAVDAVEIHPWLWLAKPTGRRLSSFSAWRRSMAVIPLP